MADVKVRGQSCRRGLRPGAQATGAAGPSLTPLPRGHDIELENTALRAPVVQGMRHNDHCLCAGRPPRGGRGLRLADWVVLGDLLLRDVLAVRVQDPQCNRVARNLLWAEGCMRSRGATRHKGVARHKGVGRSDGWTVA